MRAVAALILFVLASPVVTQLRAEFVIDDFEQGGPFLLVADQANPSAGITASLISVPGGAREVLLTAPTDPGYVVNAALAGTADDDAIVFSGMNPPNSGFSAANVNYGDMIGGQPELNLDLTPFGDRFYFDIADDNPFSGYYIVLAINSNGTGAFSTNLSGVPGNILANGSVRYELPFSFFANEIDGTPFDPSDIDGLNIWVVSGEVRLNNPPLKITEFGVVPEPSTLALSTLGLISFAARGWRNRHGRASANRQMLQAAGNARLKQSPAVLGSLQQRSATDYVTDRHQANSNHTLQFAPFFVPNAPYESS